MLRVLSVARGPLYAAARMTHEGSFAAAAPAARMATTGPKTATPPADAARGATADLCDVFIKEPVDLVAQHPVSIVQPIFR